MYRKNNFEIFDDYLIQDGIRIEREELVNYYSTHSQKSTEHYYNIGHRRWDKLVSKWGIKKDNNQIQITHRITCLERYGDETFNNTEKNNNTKIKNYGSLDECYRQRNILSMKTKDEKYGDPFFHNINKAQETCIEKYGKISYLLTDEYINNHDYQKDIEKRKNTNLEKYGAEHYFQTDEFKEISYNSRKERGTFNSSSAEKLLVEYYKKLYGEDNVISPYREERYPFNCDIYIVSEDKFIELQGHWTHGKEDYDPNNEEHQKEVKKLLSKESKYYKQKLYVWTILDPRKLEFVTKNNLNFERIKYFKKKGRYYFSNNIVI